MKQVARRFNGKVFVTTLLLCFYQAVAWAQDTEAAKIDPGEVGNWFSRNWMWVAIGAVVLILLIAMMSGGSKTKKKTTIVREEDASGVVRTTTTEIRE